jgi:methionyl aminopeptidase
MAKTNKNGIKIHEAEDFDGMRKAGRLAAEVLDYIADHVQEGVTTQKLNDLCHEMIVSRGAIPAPLGYKGFPRSICTSLNHVVCHGIPEEKKLQNGDILNIDVTVILDGWYGDTSRMFWVGDTVPVLAKRLTAVTYEAMMAGIEQVKPGARLGDIGNAIQTIAEKNGYSVVTDYCGHGLGRVFHDAPNVLHYGKAGTGLVLEAGMFFTIEPMINQGKAETVLHAASGIRAFGKKDDWTVTTKDRKLSAQFEHSLGVTEDGYEIFTVSPKGRHFPPFF